jgi:RimJ/RimL family protein N-acetyltransferase
VSEPVSGEGFRLRRATSDDAEFLASLATNEEISPFLAAVSPHDADGFLEEIERAENAPREHGRFVIEAERDGDWWAAGSVAFEAANRRSRIAHLYGLMLRPDFRGCGLAQATTRLFTRHLIFDLNYHRVQLECYGFNERALKHFERAGYVKEGVRRRAYWRNEEWVDGVLFGLVREDLEGREGGPLEHERARPRS